MPWLVDTPALRSWVAQAAGQAIGRPVTFRSLSVRPLPLPTIQVRGLEVADEPRFGGGRLLAVGEGRLGMRLWPLLRGRVEATEVTLSGVRLEVVKDATGRLNLLAALAAPLPSPGGTARPGGTRPPSGVPASVLAPRIRIIDGTVRYRELGGPPGEIAASGITATFTRDEPGAPVQVSGEALVEPGGTRLTLVGATVAALPGRPLAESALHGTVEVEAGDLSAVLRPVLPSPEVQGAARGRFELGGTLARPTATGALTVDRATLVEERRRCGEPRRRRLVLEKVSVPVMLSPPRLDGAPVTARVAGGQIALGLGIALDGGPAVTVRELRVHGVEASAFLVDYLCQPWAVRGPLDLTGDLALRGPDYAQSAAGSGRLRVGRGRVTGPDAAAVLADVQALTGTAVALLKPDRRRAGDGAPLDFESITATYTVSSGVIRSDDLVYEGRGFRVTGVGTYALADGRVSLDATFAQGDNHVRATIAGPPGALRITPTSVRIREGRDLRRLLDRLSR